MPLTTFQWREDTSHASSLFESYSVISSYNGDPIFTTGDVNGDGFDDLLTGSCDIYLANGNGGFASPARANQCPVPTDPQLADVNGDGRDDMVRWANYQIHVALSQAPLTFGPWTVLATNTAGPGFYALGDTNGD
ncbi:MAG: VCBS repeat-containing protein, partial [Magnetococcus sp. WYHC-3]